MTRLLVWRHGNTDYNAGGRVQGQTDAPLNARGRDQAAAAAALLATYQPDALISSDLSRAFDTASALASLTGLSVTPDVRLRERHFGEWQGSLLTDIETRHPTEYARWRAGEPSPGCGIESLDDLAKRVMEALQDAASLAPGGTVVVTTHGGAARQGCGALLGWPNEATRTLGSLHNCHWTELRDRSRRTGGTGWQLMAHNVGTHSQI
ncbi:histidine phosphatase family protein [Asanoa sp. WMMD1127]|uniref:histidine phosphatase family protein n=1 Tax=Asanoa sp. WMMD1127 TaxID=3016107 RepID=UPI002416AB9B|nr:histidine phosphatase family protein [Asanoa sp. WMMD1127]MDG4827631.1 histidine phosphatase family protein [Asanoa sp. WMMD1127]